jgi:dipeptidyl aminopeptidase/acylaminoacyl peptidase
MLQSNQKLIQPDDLFRLKYIHGGQLSPDGKCLAYTISHTDAAKDEEYVTLWLMDLASGQTRQLTSGSTKDMFPQWSPNGKQIAFMSTRGAKAQIYLISPEGGETRQLTSLEQGVSEGPVWSPDGSQIAFAAGPQHEPRDPKMPYRITRPTYRFDGLNYIDDVTQEIYVVSVASGSSRKVTNENGMSSSPRWSPDNSHLLYTASMLPDTQRNIFPTLRAINLNTSQITTIVDGKPGHFSAAEWMPDGKHIAYVGVPHYEGNPFGTKNDLWIVGFTDGEGVTTSENRTVGIKTGIGSYLQPDMPVWHLLTTPILISPDGQTAYVTVEKSGMLHIYQVALTGQESWKAVVEGIQANMLLDASYSQQTLLYAVSTLNQPCDLFTFDLKTGSAQQITAINDDVLKDFAQPTIENFRVTTPENVEVEAWLMKPPTGEAPYPTVLYIHGGPYGSFGQIYNFDFQILAAAGFAVLFPNFRGSGGYGADFSKAVTGNWGEVVYVDNMAVVDYAIAQGWADADRLGICGYSHGGFASCWTIGHTDRFKAAVPENPVVNWMTAYSVSDAGVSWISEELGGHPHQIPNVYLEKSPIMYAHNCKTPTLLITGEWDYRCPSEEAEQFYGVLKANGCTVEMLRLPNSVHIGAVIGPTVVRHAQNEALVDWFKRYLV